MPTDLHDRELVALILEGEKRAAEVFCERFWGFVRSVVARDRRGKSPYTPDEMAQEVFLRLWAHDCRALREWRGDGDIAPYLATIARNLAREKHRRHGNDPAIAEPGATEPTDPEPLPDELAQVEERRRRIGAAMARLSPRDRDLVERKFVQDQDYVTIARELGMQTNAVYVAIHRALARLHSAVHEADHTDPHAAVPPGGAVRRRPHGPSDQVGE